MHQVVLNDYVDAALCGFFVLVVIAMAVYGVIWCVRALAAPRATAQEVGLAAAAE